MQTPSLKNSQDNHSNIDFSNKGYLSMGIVYCF